MRRFSAWLFPFLLIGITLFICLRNYTPGTYLTGWDTLHPEFNFSLNLSRVLSGVWRFDQGLGAVAAHSHMAELPRILLLLVFSLFAPNSLLRYIYTFLCFIIGPLGVYIFTRYILQHTHHDTGEKHHLIMNFTAFLSALAYIFNLGTVQHFFVPFEMFPTQYATLGWLFYFSLRFLKQRQKKDLALFSLATFFAAPMAYASLLWYAYFGSLLLFLGTAVYATKQRVIAKRALLLVGVTLAINAFWLLPNWYFLGTHASEVPLAKTNQFFSPEAFLHNKQFGNIVDTALFKNFLFNWSHYTGEQGFTDLLSSWTHHLNQPLVLFIGYGVFGIACLGMVMALVQRNKYALCLLPFTLFSLVMIINMNPPFSWVFDLIRNNISLFKEGLRFPFTKFSIVWMFGIAVFFGYGVDVLFAFIRKHTKGFIPIIVGGVFTILLIYYGWPMFQGELIDRQMRIKIPTEYFELFDWFNEQPNAGRVAPLPIHSMWGWEYYNWGYQGAGFLWFGIKQPLLVRDFDRWNETNEQYYREMSAAVYGHDVKAIEKTAQKYDIKWFLLDDTVIAPGNDAKILYTTELKELLAQSEKIKLIKTLAGHLFIYEVSSITPSQEFVSFPQKLTSIGPQMHGSYFDQAYVQNGDYITTNNNQLTYPWRELTTRSETFIPGSLHLEGDVLQVQFPFNQDGSFSTPALDKETIFPTEVVGIIENAQRKISLNTSWMKQPTVFAIPETELLYAAFKKDNIIPIPKQFIHPTVLGTANISMNNNQLMVFGNVPIVPEINFSRENVQPTLCGNSKTSPSFGISVMGKDSLKISSQYADVCAYVSLTQFAGFEIISNQSLLRLTYESPRHDELCLYNTKTGQCFSASTKSQGEKQELMRIVTPEEFKSMAIRFSLHGQAFFTSTNVTFSQLRLEIFPTPLMTQYFSVEINQEKLLSTTGTHIQIRIPVTSQTVNMQNEPKRAQSCGTTKPVVSQRSLIDYYVRFSATNGASCDYVPFDEFEHADGKLLIVEARNISGLPTRICVTNQTTRHCDIYVTLDQNPEWKSYYFLIPPSGDGAHGYDINMNTVSIGNIPSVNDIRRLQMVSLPYTWLQSLAIINPEEPQEIQGQNFLQSVTTSGSNFYTIRGTTQGGYVVLNTSFEPGWIAVSKSPSSLLPKLLTSHILINNWANGWKIPNTPANGWSASGGNYEPRTIIIFFWPQLLEYVGFLFMPLPFVLLYFSSKRS